MKFAVSLLIVGTALTVVAALALSLFPRDMALYSLGLVRYTLLIAGLSVMVVSTRQLRRQAIELKVVKSKD
jgi:hypothetical protein